jgi:hypothetical protein
LGEGKMADIPTKLVPAFTSNQLRVALLAMQNYYGYECFAETKEITHSELTTILKMTKFTEFDKECSDTFGDYYEYNRIQLGIVVYSILVKLDEMDADPDSIIIFDFANNLDKIAGDKI